MGGGEESKCSSTRQIGTADPLVHSVIDTVWTLLSVNSNVAGSPNHPARGGGGGGGSWAWTSPSDHTKQDETNQDTQMTNQTPARTVETHKTPQVSESQTTIQPKN